MKAAAFNEMIAQAYTKPLKTVTVYARLLKEAGLMSTGARGRNAPEMTPLDAARITLAILTTDSPAQCVERVRRFGQIKYTPSLKWNSRWRETIQPEEFHQKFKGETLEEVIAYMVSLPEVLGIEESSKWYNENAYHLHVHDFDVRAELIEWHMEGGELIGERVVPFKGEVMVKTESGFRHVEDFTPIKGGVRTERATAGLSFLSIGLGLMRDEDG